VTWRPLAKLLEQGERAVDDIGIKRLIRGEVGFFSLLHYHDATSKEYAEQE
jgi:hypothetical protein